MYLDLRTFFLHFFGIEEERLEEGVWSEEFHDMKSLQQWDSISAKKKRYLFLSAARAQFMSKNGFHKCLREAITEIRTAVYTPPLHDKEFGTWSYRNRNAKKRIRIDEKTPSATPN
ncbi:hypothetical protein CAEBREN_15031 [Caenorhabditis brenneri]|uniref:Uncharacterized protein n=1 Tax=Caenorhabditis brenneri TaxID=135651 RepID=G0MTU6_CAEBE|nr:hypothetical protein CAEBREN_15031 [Caenorhabditis brenneri]